jgi:hypothetical protein
MRCYDSHHRIIAADIAEGDRLKAALPMMLRIDGTAYVHLHYAKFGCYAARAVATTNSGD